MPTVARIAKVLWALPNTLLGLAIASSVVVAGGSARYVHGAIEAQGRLIRWMLTRLVPIPGGASALTLGHVILGVNENALSACRQHEWAHVRQYERWGPFFIPAYFGASLIARMKGGDPYLDNVFERQARQQDHS